MNYTESETAKQVNRVTGWFMKSERFSAANTQFLGVENQIIESDLFNSIQLKKAKSLRALEAQIRKTEEEIYQNLDQSIEPTAVIENFENNVKEFITKVTPLLADHCYKESHRIQENVDNWISQAVNVDNVKNSIEIDTKIPYYGELEQKRKEKINELNNALRQLEETSDNIQQDKTTIQNAVKEMDDTPPEFAIDLFNLVNEKGIAVDIAVHGENVVVRKIESIKQELSTLSKLNELVQFIQAQKEKLLAKQGVLTVGVKKKAQEIDDALQSALTHLDKIDLTKGPQAAQALLALKVDGKKSISEALEIGRVRNALGMQNSPDKKARVETLQKQKLDTLFSTTTISSAESSTALQKDSDHSADTSVNSDRSPSPSRRSH